MSSLSSYQRSRRKSTGGGKWPAKKCDVCGAKTKKGVFDANLMPFGQCPHCKANQCFPCVLKGSETGKDGKPPIFLCCNKVYTGAEQSSK
jgi:hypothetical protein